MGKSLGYMGQIYKTADRKVFVFKYEHFYANGNNWLQCETPGPGRFMVPEFLKQPPARLAS